MKREWTSPELKAYGSVEEITKQPKLKDVGGSDDFAQNIQTVT